MGPNGAGKSTLAKVLAGHPDCEITSGKIWLDGTDITDLDPEERAQLGLFMSFQYPVEISGRHQPPISPCCVSSGEENEDFPKRNLPKLSMKRFSLLEMKEEFKTRFLNEGFSGGEKKRNEILQMAVLEPKMAILDETDSGLDIDAMRVVSQGVLRLLDSGARTASHHALSAAARLYQTPLRACRCRWQDRAIRRA